MSFFKKSKGKRISFAPPAPPVKLKVEDQMANPSEFEIPASILAASVVAKSELEGVELQKFAIKLQRTYIKQMFEARKKEDEARSSLA